MPSFWSLQTPATVEHTRRVEALRVYYFTDAIE